MPNIVKNVRSIGGANIVKKVRSIGGTLLLLVPSYLHP
jgi:hypothetical protein